jgi:SNF2 family DNA or RNA helicase
MEIINNKGLVFDHPNPQQILNVIDKATVLPDGKVMAFWSMKTVQALRALGIPAPSPIAKAYKYNGRDPAMEHQKRMAEFVTLYKRCFNFSDMGTGKSRASLWAADYLIEIGAVKRVLILSPLSIVKTAWEADLFATCMHRSYGVAVGDATRRKKVIESGCDFVITNHDTVKHSRIELARAAFDLIIIDEGTAFNNTQTDRWKALNSLLVKDTRVWLLTGTPAANSPLQAYGLAKLICPDRVPKFFSGWKDMTMIKVSQFTFVPKKDARDTVFNALQPAIRFEKKDCLQLPPVTCVEREVEMETQQAKYYKEIKNQMLMHVAGKQITAANSGVLMSKLLQIASGTVYSDDGNVIDFRAKNRLLETLYTIQECEQKVIVFATYKHTIAQITSFLTSHGVPCEAIHGDVPPDDRTRIINSFQREPTLKALVLQPKVAAHGITLTAASVVVWFNPVSSLETWRQANDRINRLGQTNKMTVVKLIGAPIERRVYQILERRDADQTELLKLYHDELNS